MASAFTHDVDSSLDRVTQYLGGESALDVLSELEEHKDVRGATRIGVGCFSHVLLLKDLASETRVAVKAISLRKASEILGEETKLRHEVRIMRELEHANIVRLLDVMVMSRGYSFLADVVNEPPYLCICTEYIPNAEALSNVIRRGGSQPHLVFQVMPQLVSALAHMHSRGIVHRDIWSENVLVTKTGHVVLVDLGCAEYVDTGPPVNKNLNVPYMSPEAAQAEFQQTSDDCWCVGLLMCEIATGRFVADRLGNTTTPIHHVPEVLKETLQETATLAAPGIGRLCALLLSLNGCSRPSMSEVHAEIIALRNSATVSIADLLGPRTHAAATRAQPPALGGVPPARPRRRLSMGPSRAGPRLVSNGEEAGQVIITPSCSPTSPSMVTRRVSVGSIPRVATPLSLWGTMAKQRKDNLSKNPSIQPEQETLQMDPHTASQSNESLTRDHLHIGDAADKAIEGMKLYEDILKPFAALNKKMAEKQATEIADTGSPGSGSGDTSSLRVGQSISYMARSNHMWYPGKIIGRTIASWHVALDCGATKEVDDTNAWRLVTHA